MSAFAYPAREPDRSIRPELIDACRDLWAWLAQPGSWWTGAERVAMAEESRRARSCALCAARKQAISPNAVSGDHDAAPGSPLSPAVIDAVHRIVTDATRLSQTFVESLEGDGLSDGHYIELLGVTVLVVSVDAFHHAAGLDLEPLPEPVAGEPTGYRPAEAVHEIGFVAMLPAKESGKNEADLFPGPGRAPNVLRALSLVPDCVRQLRALSAAMYIPAEQLVDVAASPGRHLDRMQIELVAGRVSAVNECFY